MTASIEVTDDLATCLALRRVVFIEEQSVPEPDERDGRDGAAVHLLATWEGAPVGCARVLFDGAGAKIGRVCVLRAHRGAGLGRALIGAALALCRERRVERATLGAQVHALDFYAALGFAAEGPVFDDAGIPHRTMARAP